MAGGEIKEFDLVRLLNYVKEEKKWPFTKISGKKMARTWGFGKVYERPKEKKHQYVHGLDNLFLCHDIKIQSQHLVSFHWKMHSGIPGKKRKEEANIFKIFYVK